jgi:hypothetical protein
MRRKTVVPYPPFLERLLPVSEVPGNPAIRIRREALLTGSIEQLLDSRGIQFDETYYG